MRKIKIFTLIGSTQKKQPIPIEYFTAMLIMQYSFIVNLYASADSQFFNAKEMKIATPYT